MDVDPARPLAGRTALVTGASRGLGRDVALALAAAGADLAVTARTEPDLAETAELVQAAGARAVAVAGDVADAEHVRRLRDIAFGELGHVDILVNNAGNLLYKPLVPLPGLAPPAEGFDSAMSDDEWHSTFRVHVDGAFHVLREFGPALLERRYGRVINIASNVLGRVIPFCSAYDAAKAAL